MENKTGSNTKNYLIIKYQFNYIIHSTIHMHYIEILYYLKYIKRNILVGSSNKPSGTVIKNKTLFQYQPIHKIKTIISKGQL
jgi:hypothetical protein